MPFFIPFLIVGAIAAIAALSTSGGPEDRITLVGPTSGGKSRLGNDILGRQAFSVAASHGTTQEAVFEPFEAGWSVVDTPGVLDGDALAQVAIEAAARSRVIVLCVDGELYTPTFTWVEQLLETIQHGGRVVILPYLTKEDLRERMMPAAERRKILSRVEDQMDLLRDQIGNKNIEIGEVLLGRPDDRDELLDEIRQGMAWTKAG